jgi:hypothetical protein
MMDKEEFDKFDDCEFEIYKDESVDKENILIELAKTLSGDDLSYIVAEWMKYNNKSKFVSRAYDEATGSKLLHFRMEAEFGYYLDDLKEDEDE